MDYEGAMITMNEQIILLMDQFYKKLPMPKDILQNQLYVEVQQNVMRRLSTKNVYEVLDWLKSNINDDERNGPRWLSNISQQSYCKLLKLTKGD
jgi:hypothetical protein